jgi:chemotaxis protein CheD
VIVGVGEYAVVDDPEATITTHGLGSCVAVCLWDPAIRVAGMLHFLLPDSAMSRERAGRQPAAFADTGIPLLLGDAHARGADMARCRVYLMGGASIAGAGIDGMDVGRHNVTAARRMLSQYGVTSHGEALGGTDVRTVVVSVADGRLQVRHGRDVIQELR